MNFKRYTYKALETVSGNLKELMKQTNREEARNVFYIWHDMREQIERDLDRRTIAGEAGEEARHINDDIRRLISDNRVKQYEIADYMGISEGAFSRLLRKPLDEKQRQEIEKAINEIKVCIGA